MLSSKVSADSGYLNKQTAALTSKLGSVDSSISSKMDRVALAAVATSGSHSDLSSEPSLIALRRAEEQDTI